MSETRLSVRACVCEYMRNSKECDCDRVSARKEGEKEREREGFAAVSDFDPQRLAGSRQPGRLPCELSNVQTASYTAASWKQLPGASVSLNQQQPLVDKSRHSFIKNRKKGKKKCPPQTSI